MSRVRIVGGQWRSRLIEVAAVRGLRPTPDRVRETLFNWLGQDLTGQHCLDLFAGTGILGFEAASRGAAHVTLVDRHPAAVAALQQSRITLQAAQVEVIRGNAVEFAKSVSGSFDIAFLDPPYHQGLLERVAPWLGRIMKPGGRLYVESEQSLDSLGTWRTVKQGRAGQVHYHLMRGDVE